MSEDRDKQSQGNTRSLTDEAGLVQFLSRADTTTTAWFGPNIPMTPVAPDSVRGRVFDFPVGYNLAVRPRHYDSVSFEMLRAFADSCDVLRLVIESRKDQMARRTWNIVPLEDDAHIDDDRRARIARVKAFFRRPDQENFWGDWLRLILEDLFVIDAPAIYRRRTYGGDLYALEPLDGGTIKRVINNLGRTPEPPEPAYQQVLKGLPAVDYTSRDLLYRPRNVRTHKIYGFSPVEQIVMTINIAIRRQTWQLQSFTEGNIPEALIGTPDTWTPDQIAQFQAWFDSSLEGNTAQQRHAKFVPGAIAKGYVATKPQELFGPAEEWLARVVCYAFNVSPQPFVNMMNRATAETAQETAVIEGLAPIENWVKSIIDTVLIEDFNSPDLQFSWQEDDELDPSTKSQIIDREVGSGLLTFNDARIESGRKPIDHPDAERPMFRTAAGYVPIFLTPEEQAQKDAMAAMASATAPGDEGALPNGGDGSGGTGSPPASDDLSGGPPAPPSINSADIEKGDIEKGDIEKRYNPNQPRVPAGNPKGGQFASGDGYPPNTAESVKEILSPEEVQHLRDLIDQKAGAEEILALMEPFSAPDVEPTLTLLEDGSVPEGFFEGRTYNLPDGSTTDIEGAIKYLIEEGDKAAGPGGPRYDKESIFLIGPPAAGKSTLAERLAANGYHVVDSDEAKKIIPGYDNGFGAARVHEESSAISKIWHAQVAKTGRNILSQTTSFSSKSASMKIEAMNEAGYKTDVIGMEISTDEAVRRMASRAIRTGRSVPAELMRAAPVATLNTYMAVKNKGAGYARVSSEGREPLVLDSTVRWLEAGKPLLGKSRGGGGTLSKEGGEGRVRPSLQGPGHEVRKAHRHGPDCQEGLKKAEGDNPGMPPFLETGEATFDNREDEVPVRAEDRLAAAISDILVRLAASIREQLIEVDPDSLFKADLDPRELERLLESLDMSIWAELQNEFERDIGEVFEYSGLSSLARLGAVSSVVDEVVVATEITNIVSNRAVNWAKSYAADRVGTSPNPKFSLAESTRRMIKGIIVDGLIDNIGMPKIADAIADSYPMSPERARIIAATDVTSANSLGALEGYKVAEEMGIRMGKSWLVKDDEKTCPVCVGNGEQGVISLDEPFQSGDMAPGAHPHCRCVLIPHVLDEVAKGDFDESKVNRVPAGSSAGGQFTSGGGVAVNFEVAPDPNDEQLTDDWEALSEEEKKRISREVAEDVVPEVLEELGVEGEIEDQIGGYMGLTNPSMAVRIGDPADSILVASFLGHALSQDSMMLVSDSPGDGFDEVGIVSIEVPESDRSLPRVAALYDRLYSIRDSSGKPAVGGFTFSGREMHILNYSSDGTVELAGKIDTALKGGYNVSHTKGYAAFIGKDSYDASIGTEGSSPVRQAADRIRGEASNRIRKEIDRSRRGLGKADFDESKVTRKPRGQSGGGQFASPSSAAEQLQNEVNVMSQLDPRLGVMERWLLDEGEEFGPVVDINGFQKGPQKQCYMNAFRALSDAKVGADWSYTEGKVYMPGFPFGIDHAWLSNSKGEVLETTIRDVAGLKYYGVPFKTGYVYDRAAQTGYYGVFSDGVTADTRVVGRDTSQNRAWPKGMTKFDESKVNRVPAGNSDGGQFTSDKHQSAAEKADALYKKLKERGFESALDSSLIDDFGKSGVDIEEWVVNMEKSLPRELIDEIANGPKPLFKRVSNDEHGDTVAVSVLMRTSPDEFMMRRSLEFNKKTGEVSAYHDMLSFKREHQGKGFAKAIMASQIETYQSLGVSHVSLIANLNVGAYAWAKYGFVPKDSGEWDRVMGAATRKAMEPTDTRGHQARLNGILETASKMVPSKGIRFIADSKYGKELLIDTEWRGKLDLKDPESMQRFKHYVGGRNGK
jgi:GNAT superfamily N-acetyltransferase